MKKRNTAGFTLVEVIIVLIIVGILITVITASFGPFRRRQAIENATNELMSALTTARSKTLAAVGNTSYSVELETNDAVIFTGTTYSSGTSTNEIVTYDTPVTMASKSLNGGGAQVSFDRLKGTTSNYGTIVLQLPTGESHTITVSATGTVIQS